MSDEVTPEEQRAIDSLKRLAKRWPKTLTLASMGGSLHVLRSGYELDFRGGIPPEAEIETIRGIPNTGGDW